MAKQHIERGSHSISELFDMLINAGPRLPQAMAEVTSGIENLREAAQDFQEAGTIMLGRAGGAEVTDAELTAEDRQKIAKISELMNQHEGVADAGREGKFTDLFLTLIKNPAFLTFIMSMFLK